MRVCRVSPQGRAARPFCCRRCVALLGTSPSSSRPAPCAHPFARYRRFTARAHICTFSRLSTLPQTTNHKTVTPTHVSQLHHRRPVPKEVHSQHRAPKTPAPSQQVAVCTQCKIANAHPIHSMYDAIGVVTTKTTTQSQKRNPSHDSKHNASLAIGPLQQIHKRFTLTPYPPAGGGP